METLADFVVRLSKDVGCYYHLIPSGTWYSLKKYEFPSQGRKNVFGWTKELKRTGIFKIDILYEFSKNDNIRQLADEIKDGINFGNPGIIFKIKGNSDGRDYKKAVTALKAVMELI